MPNWIDLNELWSRRRDRKWESFSWLTVRALLSSVNDVVGKGAPRLVNDMRGAWVARQRQVADHGAWDQNLVIQLQNVKKFLLLGDPGEQDFSQYAVVPVLQSRSPDAGFMVILSDVIYPSGDVNDYVDGFYVPYRSLALPIFAMPGNHDWYDGLDGFMWHFCGAEPLPPDTYSSAGYSLRERLARRMWRKAAAPRRDVLEAFREERSPDGPWRPRQPGPYFAIETEQVMVVCVDSGITGDIDRAQAEWLVSVSESSSKPKIMLVGRPLLCNKTLRRGPFAECGIPLTGVDGTVFGCVDDVARHAAFRYVAAIGGDTHNYQRFDVTLAEGAAERPFHYVVSGGGGAYMSATHTIPAGAELCIESGPDLAPGAIVLDRFESYPSRADSLVYFADLVVPRLWRLVVRVVVLVLGIAVASAVALSGIPGDSQLDTALMAGAIVAAALLGAVASRQGGRRAPEDRPGPGLGYLMAFVFGGVIGLAAWWLSPEDFGCHMALVASGAVLACGVALVLRRFRWWRNRAVSLAALIGQPLIGMAALVLFVLDGADLGRAGVALVATLLLPVLLVIRIDHARARRPHGYETRITIELLALIGLAVVVLDASWARALLAAGVITILALLVIVIAHLHFLSTFTLLWRPGDRRGTLEPEEAEAILAWRTPDGPEPEQAHTRRIGNMVHPGSLRPHGPMHQFISEAFDKDYPPLMKNFLEVGIGDRDITVTCFHATGAERGPEDVTSEEPIVIPY